MIHFKEKLKILEFLKENPMWLAGFTSGEGCFTAYLSYEIKALWSLQPGLDFNITQNSDDKILLEAINLFFEEKGGVYDKFNNVSVVAFRNIKILQSNIIPFFNQFHLVGTKSYEYEKWLKLVEIMSSKRHIMKNNLGRDSLLEFLEINVQLNFKRNNLKKIRRLTIIKEWLLSLKSLPTYDDKLRLKYMIQELR